MMDEHGKDQWRWRIARKLADFMDRPDAGTEQALTALLQAYRQAISEPRPGARPIGPATQERHWH